MSKTVRIDTATLQADGRLHIDATVPGGVLHNVVLDSVPPTREMLAEQLLALTPARSIPWLTGNIEVEDSVYERAIAQRGAVEVVSTAEAAAERSHEPTGKPARSSKKQPSESESASSEAASDEQQ